MIRGFYIISIYTGTPIKYNNKDKLVFLSFKATAEAYVVFVELMYTEQIENIITFSFLYV